MASAGTAGSLAAFCGLTHEPLLYYPKTPPAYLAAALPGSVAGNIAGRRVVTCAGAAFVGCVAAIVGVVATAVRLRELRRMVHFTAVCAPKTLSVGGCGSRQGALRMTAPVLSATHIAMGVASSASVPAVITCVERVVISAPVSSTRRACRAQHADPMAAHCCLVINAVCVAA